MKTQFKLGQTYGTKNNEKTNCYGANSMLPCIINCKNTFMKTIITTLKYYLYGFAIAAGLGFFSLFMAYTLMRPMPYLTLFYTLK